MIRTVNHTSSVKPEYSNDGVSFFILLLKLEAKELFLPDLMQRLIYKKCRKAICLQPSAVTSKQRLSMLNVQR